MNDMKSIVFNGKRKYKKLHIEVPGAIINITVGLTTINGEKCTSIVIRADDYEDEKWSIPDFSSEDVYLRHMNVRVVKEELE